MLIEMLITVIYTLLDKLLIFSIPNLPEQVHTYIDTLFDYLVSGASILANYVPLPYIMTLFLIIVAVDTAILIYELVLWILKKIPMISVS